MKENPQKTLKSCGDKSSRLSIVTAARNAVKITVTSTPTKAVSDFEL